MPANTNHLYAIRESDGDRVFIDEKGLPNGKKCGCICSKCKEPLVAKNRGEINAHHFAHRSDSDCRGESLAHIEAKEIIKKKKYLWVPYDYYEWYDEDDVWLDGEEDNYFINSKEIKVEFDKVEDEEFIDKSKINKYTADLICTKDKKSIVVEIIVTHDLDDNKADYLKDKKISTLNIDLRSVLKKDQYNNPPENFVDMVLKTAKREWFFNKKQKIKEK